MRFARQGGPHTLDNHLSASSTGQRGPTYCLIPLQVELNSNNTVNPAEPVPTHHITLSLLQPHLTCSTPHRQNHCAHRDAGLNTSFQPPPLFNTDRKKGSGNSQCDT